MEFLNRNVTPLPKKECTIEIKDNEGNIFECTWKPFNKTQYTEDSMPDKNYLGTAKVIKSKFQGVSFHAWANNNSEFIYYKIKNG